MDKIIKEWKVTFLLGLLIISLALGLRLYHLDFFPIFGDEAIYIRWAQVMRAEPTLRFLPLSDGKQPLFMWGVIPFFKLFSDPLFTGRFVSVLTGLGSIMGIFALTYVLFKSKKTALIAALTYAISPFSLFFDRLALVDSMLTFFGVWTLFFGVLTVKTLRLDLAMITGFTLGGALLTKSPATFFSILLPTTWIFVNWMTNAKKRILQLIKLACLLLVTFVIAYGMYNILRLGPNFQMLALRNEDYIYPLTHIFENPLDPLVPFLDRTLEWLRMLGPGIIFILGFAGILLNFKKFSKEVIVISSWLIFPILIQAEFAKILTARYILFTLPYLFVLSASVFITKKFRYLLTAGFIFFIFQSFWIDKLLLTNIEAAPLPRSERSGYLEEWTSGYGIKEVSEYLRQEWKNNPNGQMIVGTEGFFGTLPDGLQIYLNDVPEIKIFGVGVIIEKTPESLIESKKAGNRTYFVINSTRFIGHAEEQGLKLLAVYPKGVRPDGSREALLFFEVTEEVLAVKKNAQ